MSLNCDTDYGGELDSYEFRMLEEGKLPAHMTETALDADMKDSVGEDKSKKPASVEKKIEESKGKKAGEKDRVVKEEEGSSKSDQEAVAKKDSSTPQEEEDETPVGDNQEAE